MGDSRTRGAASDELGRRFNGQLRGLSSSLSVGTTPISIAGDDGERVQITFVNLAPNEIYVDLYPIPSATRGIRLGPLGGLISFDVQADGILPTCQWYAVATAAASPMLLIQCRREVQDP